MLAIFVCFVCSLPSQAAQRRQTQRTKFWHVRTSTPIARVISHPAFTGFGDFLFPNEPVARRQGMTIAQAGELLPFHSHYHAQNAANVLNGMIDRAARGEKIFYRIYSDAECKADPSKRDVGIWFLRGRRGAPFALFVPGGAFTYVASIHESLPMATETSRAGFNAFALHYRTGGGERRAAEDVAAALAFIFERAGSLGVSKECWSMWGSASGARAAAAVASYGTERYGRRAYPRAALLVTQYTGHADCTPDDPPTYAVTGSNDKIVHWQTMAERIEALKGWGVNTVFRVFDGLGHGFGLGRGTVADGWFANAVAYWKSYMKN